MTAKPPRHTKIPQQKRDADGKGLCRHCEGPVPKGRFTFCSQVCVDEALSRASATWARDACWKRDHGICAVCGRDSDADYKAFMVHLTEAQRLARWLENSAWKDMVETPHGMRFRERITDYKVIAKMRKAMWKRIGLHNPGWTTGRQTGWDADHILEVVNGGGSCGPENLQTLCHVCHKIKTARLASERAAPKPLPVVPHPELSLKSYAATSRD
jgi:5-methylcytosine-specific restriction endonuclease McrA